MDNIKRRSFLKNSSILTGSLVLPSFSFKKQKQLDKKLKISVVGCGGRGTGAAVQALRADKNVELVALCDAFEDRLERSLNAIIDELDGEIALEFVESYVKQITPDTNTFLPTNDENV